MRRAWVVLAAGCGFAPAASPTDANDVDTPEVPDARRDTATLFVADYNASMIHRFALARGDAPPPPATSLVLDHALSPVVMPTGELFVGQLASSTIARFTDPVGTLTPNGTITGLGLSTSFGKLVAVDDELWAVNAASTNVDRLAFDSAGTPSMAGTVGGIVNSVGRGMVFDAATRDLYITECCGTDTVLHFAVAGDRTVTPKLKLSGNGLANPHGMVVTPWHELLVANAGDATIRRFTLDAAGNATANGTITGNGLAVPIDLSWAPWGELFVTNQGTGTISRFLFDPTHAAIAHDTFPAPTALGIAWAALD